MIAEQAARDLGGIGLAGLDLDFRSLERLAVLGGGQGVRTGFHIDGIGPELGFHAVCGFEHEGGAVIGIGLDACGGDGLPDGDLGPSVGSDGEVAGGAADRDLVVGVPGLELRSGKRCAGAHDGLIDLELHRGVGLVGCGLHLGGGVHVADGLRAGMPRLERAHLLARDHVRHRASGGRLRDEHRLPRVQDRRRLGHEVDAAEDDHLRLHRRRLARELQRVARVIGDVLHLAPRVVVCENDGFPFRRQLSDFLLSCHAITPPHRMVPVSS